MSVVRGQLQRTTDKNQWEQMIMNALTSTILWMSVQVALFSLVGCGLFLVLRRRGPRSAATCTAIVLGMTLALALLAISPWPRWTLDVARRAVPATNHAVEAVGTQPAIDSASVPAAPSVDGGASDTVLSVWWNAAVDWLRSNNAATPMQASAQPTWRAWLPIVLAVGISFCLARLAIGVWAVRRLRNDSRPIEDEGLKATLGEMAERIDLVVSGPLSVVSCNGQRTTDNGQSLVHNSRPAQSDYASVELRESSLLRSAVTIGWRRPLLLLPCDWRSWTETERRAVLAHELVHVARRDYAIGLIARLATAIHFYQPLVLWLNRQFRIQQELAADSHAAIVSGDRQTYLTTLAQMALRADEQPLPWAARTFLPGTSSLIKRVAWLKRKGSPMEKSLSRTGRWILVTVTAAIALAVAGIRGPTDAGSPLMAQTQNQAEQKDGGIKLHVKGEGTITITGEDTTGSLTVQNLNISSLRKLDYIPADARVIVAVSPSELFKVPSLAKIAPMFNEIDRQNKLGVKSADLADVVVIKTGTGDKVDRLILRYSKPFDWKAVLKKNLPNLETKRLGDKEYYTINMAALSDAERRAGGGGGVWASNFYLPDDRTLIIGTEEEIQKIVRGGEKLISPELFPALATSPFAARMETSLLRDLALWT